MKLKVYTAKSMGEVMAQIKRELGDDAVIVSSRTENGQFRVTAALDEEPVVENMAVPDVDEFLDGIDDPAALFGGITDYGALPDPSLDAKLDNIAKALVRHGVPASLQQKILLQAEQNTAGKVLDILAAALDAVFEFRPLSAATWKRPVMLLGQPGAGKTTTIAKLATRGVMDGRTVVVITADTTRAGGVEQLAAFTKVLKLNLAKVSTPDQLKQALNDNRGAEQILVDCPGLNVFDAAAMKEMHAYTRVAAMDLIVTLPGGMDIEESMEIGRALAILGARAILPTRLDMSRRLGGILAAADRAELAFCGMGHKPEIADGFAPLDARTLAQFILPQAVETTA